MNLEELLTKAREGVLTNEERNTLLAAVAEELKMLQSTDPGRYAELEAKTIALMSELRDDLSSLTDSLG